METKKENKTSSFYFIAWIILSLGVIGFYRNEQITRGEEIISLFLLMITYKLYTHWKS